MPFPPYPGAFYFSEKSNEPKYKTTFTGKEVMDFSKVLYTDKHWRKTSPSFVEKKKNLVLADWDAGNWNYVKIKKVKEAIQQLRDNDFNIYLWQNGQVLPLTESHLNQMHPGSSVLQDMVPWESDDLIQTIEEQCPQFNKGSIHVLDGYWLEILTDDPQDLPPRTLNIANLVNFSEEKKASLFKQLVTLDPPITHIINTQFPTTEKHNDISNQVKKLFPDLSVDNTYRDILLENDDFIRNVLKNKESRTEDGQKLALSDLTNISSLDIRNFIISINVFPGISPWMPGLNQLALEMQSWHIALKDIKENVAKQLVSLTLRMSMPMNSPKLQPDYPNLEELTFYIKELYDVSILNLVGKTNKLKSFSLKVEKTKKFKPSKQDEAYYAGKLQDLEKLDLCGVNIADEKLAISLLANKPKLHSLTINACKKLLSALPDGPIFPELENLTIIHKEGAKLRPGFISKSLKHLKLKYCRLIKPDQDLELPELIDIELANCLIEKTNFAAMMQNAAYFKKACFENVRLSLNKKELSLTQDDLEAFLTKANKLISFKLESSSLENLFLSQPKKTFHFKLKNLYLSRIVLSTDYLASLLSPSLRNLELNHCHLEGNLLNNLVLSSLTSLSLERTKITTENFIQLIKNSPNLKVVNLTYIESIDFTNPKVEKLLGGLKVNRKDLAPQSSYEKNYKINEDLTPGPQFDLDENLHSPAPPSLEEYKFKYKRPLKSKDQNCIIAQLSQYLTVSNCPNAAFYIHKMQSGICAELAELFQEKDLDWWDDLFKELGNWNGKNETLNNKLKNYFAILFDKFQQIYILKKPKKKTFLGENFEAWLKKQLALSAPQSFILENAWHAIAIKCINQKWFIYDPSSESGYKEMTKEALYNAIIWSLGRQIVVQVQDNVFFPQPLISCPGTFISEAGLFYLLDVTPSELSLMMKQLVPYGLNHLTAEEIKKALLLRNVDGVPAWKVVLDGNRQEAKQYINALFEKYVSLLGADIKKNQEALTDMLAKSIEHLPVETPKDKIMEPITLPISSPNPDNKSSPVLTAIHQNIEEEDKKRKLQRALEKQFETWKQDQGLYSSSLDYCQHLVSGRLAAEKKQLKWLVKLPSSAAVTAMSVDLQHYCNSEGHAVYYIHSPDLVRCQPPYLEKLADSSGIINREKCGGDFYDFLMQNQHKKIILIVNYDFFEIDDLVRLNSLLDKNPLADGVALQKNRVIIGLINENKPGCYEGEDFYSRFGKDGVEICPLDMTALPKVPTVSEKSQDAYIIDFFQDDDWHVRLFGRWVWNKGQFVYEDGKFKTILEKSQGGILVPLVLQNGPWDNQEFADFWHRAQALGYIEWEGQHYKISSLHQANAYAWNTLQNQLISCDGRLSTKAHALNPTCLRDFFNCYDDQLNKHPGLIELAAQAGQLEVNLTRALTKHEWAMLLTKCESHGVKLVCHIAPGVVLPEELPTRFQEKALDETLLSVIQSTDIDVTVANLVRENCLIIDVTECTSADLLTRLEARFDETLQRKVYTRTDAALTKALAENKDNKRIILKGTFSPELVDALAPLLLSEKGKNICLITEDAKHFNYLNVHKHHVTVEEKAALLGNEVVLLSKEELAQTPLSKLRAILMYRTASANHLLKNNGPWYGLRGLSGRIKLKAFNAEKSKEIADKFIAKRQKEVAALLSLHPYVFLTGLSGVGKTTFVDKYVKKMIHNAKIYKSEANLIAWAKDHDDPDQYKVLFIDEANTVPSEWSKFEGLFNPPPSKRSIVIEGKPYELSDKHKVIFAGNPLNYGADRQIASLFKRHGGALAFKAMPLEYIYEDILKPIFNGTPLAKQSLAVAEVLLKRYKFICECSKDEVLISPRELEMIAMFVISHLQTMPIENKSPAEILRVTQHYATLMTRNLVPDVNKEAFDKHFPTLKEKEQPLKVLDRNDKNKLAKKDNFIVTPSRQPVHQHLLDLLSLREFRREHQKELSDAQLYGGLGGAIIEGEPGVGKSDLVIASLIAQGYEEIKDLKKKNVPVKSFYCMPCSMDIAEKEKLLKRAFKEGAIVVMDEINSSPMMEGLLNDLLTGKHPSGKQEKRRPGFMIIGTQNPISMGGRYPQSTALKRRLTTLNLPPYPEYELKAILQFKGLMEEIATNLVNAYQKCLNYAKARRLKPAPTFRALEEAAGREIKKYKQDDIYGGLAKLNDSMFTLFADKEIIHPLKDQLKKINWQI